MHGLGLFLAGVGFGSVTTMFATGLFFCREFERREQERVERIRKYGSARV
jgi:hypothetical protein